MIAEHIFTVIGVCPVNGARDAYSVTVETRAFLEASFLVDTAQKKLAVPILQEDFTVALAERLTAKVTTLCQHGAVLSKVSHDATLPRN